MATCARVLLGRLGGLVLVAPRICQMARRGLRTTVVGRSASAAAASSPGGSPHTTNIVLSPSAAERLAARLTPALLAQVQQCGFAVADGVLADDSQPPPPSQPQDGDRSPPSSSPLADEMRERILLLYRRGVMRLNHTHLVHAGARALVPKASIHEADFSVQTQLLFDEEGKPSNDSQGDAAFWREFVEGAPSIHALNRHFESSCRFDRQTVKAQVCPGGAGCFPMHFDTDRKVDSRRLTAVLYLNPSWSASVDGGSLRVYPFPHSAVDVSPIHDRMVLFDSTRTLHRVLPSHRERVCISIWFWQEQSQWRAQLEGAAGEPAFAPQRHAALQRTFSSASPAQLQTLGNLLSPAYRPHLAKLYYAYEWLTSLEQSHSETAERQQMLIKHLDEVDMIERALGGPLRTLTQRPEAKTQPADQAWRSWLATPLLRPQATALPPFCQHVEPTSPLRDLAHLTPHDKLIDWMGN